MNLTNEEIEVIKKSIHTLTKLKDYEAAAELRSLLNSKIRATKMFIFEGRKDTIDKITEIRLSQILSEHDNQVNVAIHEPTNSDEINLKKIEKLKEENLHLRYLVVNYNSLKATLKANGLTKYSNMFKD